MVKPIQVASTKPMSRQPSLKINPAEWLSIRMSISAFCVLAVAGLVGIVVVWQYGNREVTTAFGENQRYVAAVGAAYKSRETNDDLAQAVLTFRASASPQAEAAFVAAAKDLHSYLDDTQRAGFGAAITADAVKTDTVAAELSPAFAHFSQLAAQLGLGAHADDPASLPVSIKAASDQFTKQAEALNSSGNMMAFTRIMAQVPKLNSAIQAFMSTGDPKLPAEIEARFTGVQRAIEGADLDEATSGPLIAALQGMKGTYSGWVDANAAYRIAADQLLATSSTLKQGLLGIREKLAAEASAEASRLDEIRLTTDRQLGIIMASVGGVIIAFAILLFVAVLRPLQRVSVAVRTLAEGKLNVDLANLPRRHELGSIAQALAVFRTNAVARSELEEAQAREREQAVEAQRRQMHDLADLFERGTTSIAVEVALSATRMRELASLTAEGSNETKKRVRSTQDVAENSSGLVNAVAGAAEELNASFLTVKDQIVRTREVAQAAVVGATTASERIAQLSSSVSEINSVLALIHEIAEQTNLLALNATIEAARAGDAGKGFAVVATEVKALANQTAKATAEISDKISNISASTGSAVEAIQQIGSRISDVQQYAAAVASAIEEQWHATQEIAHNAEDASSNVSQIRSDLQTVDLAANDGISSAQGVLEAATTLVGHSDRLKAQLGEFLEQVRSN